VDCVGRGLVCCRDSDAYWIEYEIKSNPRLFYYADDELSAPRPDAVEAYQAVPMISGARNLTIAAAFGGKTAEHIIEVGRMPGRAAHAALHLATRGADDEIGDFEARFVRAFWHEATFDRKRSGGVQRGELVERVADDWIGALRTFNDDPYSLARQGGSNGRDLLPKLTHHRDARRHVRR